MKVRQTIINDYEAVHYKADMVTGWAYADMLYRFGRAKPTLYPKRKGETIDEAYKRIRKEDARGGASDFKKYYQHGNEEIVISPKHGMIYIFKDGDILKVRKKDLKANDYEILEAE
ncbi:MULTISPECIES: hypothetical protein [Listeria]|uniref:hypothetical protein n=1 Tax=Listeria TaxID=1637 RepID=UPI000B58C287|nr:MULTISPECIES: hypothetical protein [Listeria]